VSGKEPSSFCKKRTADHKKWTIKKKEKSGKPSSKCRGKRGIGKPKPAMKTTGVLGVQGKATRSPKGFLCVQSRRTPNCGGRGEGVGGFFQRHKRRGLIIQQISSAGGKVKPEKKKGKEPM